MFDVEDITEREAAQQVIENFNTAIACCVRNIEKGIKDFDALELEDGSIINVEVVKDEPAAIEPDSPEYWQKQWENCFALLRDIGKKLELIERKYWQPITGRDLGDIFDLGQRIHLFLEEVEGRGLDE